MEEGMATKEVEDSKDDQPRAESAADDSHISKLDETTRSDGAACIKPEYIDHDHKRVLAAEYLPKDLLVEFRGITEGNDENTGTGVKSENPSEPVPKRQKLKGRYKSRPNERKPEDGEKICHAILKGQECRFGDKCKFTHNVDKYLENKLADVGDSCYMFTTYGRCPYGLSCRYGSSHIEDSKNVVNEKLHSNFVNKTYTCNALCKTIQLKLRKRQYDFSRANQTTASVLRSIKAPVNAREFDDDNDQLICDNPDPAPGDPSPKENNDCDDQNASATEKPEKADPVAKNGSADVVTETEVCRVKLETISTPNDEEGIRLRRIEKKKVDFRNKLYLAPLTTVGNLPFRRVCKQFGVDITCGEMAMSTNLLQGKNSEWALLRRHESEDIFGVQLCGSFPDSMTRCGQLIMEQAEVDFIDVNCGCPIDLVFKKGGGCALMSRQYKFEQIVRGMTSVLDVPLTIKMRTGIFEDKSNAHLLVPKLRDWGVSMVTIHGRSREQRYTRLADWDYINLCASVGKPMPIYGNGDILSFKEANFSLNQTDISGLMVARGALVKPWVFTEIKEQRHWDISSSERMDMLKKFVNFGLEHWGSDTQGVGNVRRFLLEWLSFLYRYIPVGVLERLPQKINEKPPFYFGRDDLETMMASPNCGDWVKLSEMLLGPVPDGFTFVPKHKANAYK